MTSTEKEFLSFVTENDVLDIQVHPKYIKWFHDNEEKWVREDYVERIDNLPLRLSIPKLIPNLDIQGFSVNVVLLNGESRTFILPFLQKNFEEIKKVNREELRSLIGSHRPDFVVTNQRTQVSLRRENVLSCSTALQNESLLDNQVQFIKEGEKFLLFEVTDLKLDFYPRSYKG